MKAKALVLFIAAAIALTGRIEAQSVSVGVAGGIAGAFGKDSSTGTTFGLECRKPVGERLAVEGSLENLSIDRENGYGTVQLSLIYYLRDTTPGRMRPYLSGGIGALSDDFTELPTHVLARFGAGAQYRLDDFLAFEAGLTTDLVHTGNSYAAPARGTVAVIPALRVGVVVTF